MAAETEAGAVRHRQLAAIPHHNIKCYSMLFPIPPISTQLPSIVTNASSCASLWRARKASHKEVCLAYTLTDRMQEESANMTEATLAAVLSNTTPLSLLEQYYGSVEKCVTSYWRSCPKAGGSAMSADIANTILHSTVPVDDRVGERDLIMPIVKIPSRSLIVPWACP